MTICAVQRIGPLFQGRRGARIRLFSCRPSEGRENEAPSPTHAKPRRSGVARYCIDNARGPTAISARPPFSNGGGGSGCLANRLAQDRCRCRLLLIARPQDADLVGEACGLGAGTVEARGLVVAEGEDRAPEQERRFVGSALDETDGQARRLAALDDRLDAAGNAARDGGDGAGDEAPVARAATRPASSASMRSVSTA